MCGRTGAGNLKENRMELMNKTIGQCLHERAGADGAHLSVETEEWSCSFSRLDALSDLLAVRMGRLGIREGTHAGIWGANSPDWVMAFLALSKLGAVPVLINTCYKKDELKGILDYSEVEVLFYGTGLKNAVHGEIISQIRAGMPGIRHFIPLGGELFTEGGGAPKELSGLQKLEARVGPDHPACMIFTSGTTSLPKGVVLTHRNLVNNGAALVAALGWGAGDKMCISVPMFHCFGITAGIVSCILGGMSMYLVPYFRTAPVWSALEKHRCTILNGVPSMFLAMIRKAEYRERKAEGVRSGIIAGSPFTREEFLEISEHFPGMHLQPSYGQTETSPCVTIADWDEPKEKKAVSVGRVIEHVKVRIADAKTGEVLGTGREGEIQVKGYNVMSGYYKRPEADEKAFTADGWLRTGDLGSLDGEGELRVTGRLKEIIIRAGENISPYEIEEVIKELEWVDSVKVIGVPAEVLKEEIAACIVPRAGRRMDKEGLRSYLEPRLARYKLPAYIMEFDRLPMNASGKVELQALRQMASQRAAGEREGRS